MFISKVIHSHNRFIQIRLLYSLSPANAQTNNGEVIDSLPFFGALQGFANSPKYISLHIFPVSVPAS